MRGELLDADGIVRIIPLGLQYDLTGQGQASRSGGIGSEPGLVNGRRWDLTIQVVETAVVRLRRFPGVD